MSLLLRKRQFTLWAVSLALTASLLAGCGLMGSPTTALPTPTDTATPVPTPTNTPVPPTATPAPAEKEDASASASSAAPVDPKVTIPQGYSAVLDDRLGYSFAVPRGWTELDLRGAQFRQMATLVGQGGQLDALDGFLESPEGQMLGKIYIADLMSAMMGGLPSAIAVTVVDAPGYTNETAKELVDGLIKANAGLLGEVKIDTLEATTVNNVPAVVADATANLAQVGMNNSVYAKVVALVANDKIYVMLLAAQADQRGAKEPVFDGVIGTFRPE